jgi:hypothetical protein
MQSYDWHLSLEALESRDGYFTNLMHVIESAYHQNNKQKVVLVCHSLGGVLFTWFSQFTTARDATWMDKYVHANVLLGAPLLGAPKAINGLLSGDLPDFHVNFAGFDVQSSIFKSGISKDVVKFTIHDVVKFARNFESVLYMLPKGGDDFWARYAWEDDPSSSDLSKLLQDSENIKRVLNSELCTDNDAHDCSHNNTCTVESVLGNVQGRKVSVLCRTHGIVFTVSAAGFCFF